MESSSSSTSTTTKKKATSPWLPSIITFAAGASYGVTTVVLGQPLDTIKTRMQGMPETAKENSFVVGKTLFRKEGLRGLYRGGLPLLVGGSLMRSAQFGVSSHTKTTLDGWEGLPAYKLFGTLDYKVILAGMAGGAGRAVVEIPTDFFKVRRQVEHEYSFKSVLDGTVVTMGRNTVLFAAFMVYIDLTKQACQAGWIPSFLMTTDQSNLTPFAKGAICANFAWLTVWPMDVVKTQRQSGNYSHDLSAWQLLKDNYQSGRLFRGLLPGLVRSSIANGSSMAIYEFVHSGLTSWTGAERKDMT